MTVAPPKNDEMHPKAATRTAASAASGSAVSTRTFAKNDN